MSALFHLRLARPLNQAIVASAIGQNLCLTGDLDGLSSVLSTTSTVSAYMYGQEIAGRL